MHELQQQFKSQYPDTFFLDYDIDNLSDYLKSQNFLLPNEEITKLEKPGEGNMNFVLRVITDQRTFIAKQARPWVEKYPQIAAPVKRNEAEAAYYATIQKHEVLATYSPGLLYADKAHFIAFYTDLGSSSDFTYLYHKGQLLDLTQLSKLLTYLSELHTLAVGDFPENKGMRELNHEHIFNYPFRENNGFDLDAVQIGLSQLASPYKTDEKLKKTIAQLGTMYLSEGKCLIQGDFYPGSWIDSEDGIKIIDPEFSFLGFAEFDLGVLIAHLYLTAHPKEIIDQVFTFYEKPQNFDDALVAGFAGTEILRRLFGVAQLPLALSIQEKRRIILKAAEWVKTGKIKL